MLLRFAIDGKPENQPDHTERTRNHEGPAPAPAMHNPGSHEGSDARAHCRPSVKDSGRQGSFLLRKPLRDRSDAGRKHTGFSESKRRTSYQKATEAAA